jgi:hypothetical protein
MLEQMNEQLKRSGTVIAIHKFKLLKNNEEYVFLFVEGEDDLYFYPQNAKNIFSNKQVLALSCDGKKGVIEVHEILSDEINDNVIAGFFVDRDFDEQSNNSVSDKVYITPSYSVENLVYNESTFINLLIGRFGLIPTDNEYLNCLSLFEIMSTKFYNAIHLYNSWIFAQRNYVTTDKKLNLPKNLPKGFVTLKSVDIESDYDLTSIEALHTKAPKLDNEVLDKASQILKEELPEQRFRGKFNWVLFSHIIGFLIDDANNESKRSYLSDKVKFNISRTDSRKFFEEVSPFAKPPQCLLDYFGAMAA